GGRLPPSSAPLSVQQGSLQAARQAGVQLRDLARKPRQRRREGISDRATPGFGENTSRRFLVSYPTIVRWAAVRIAGEERLTVQTAQSLRLLGESLGVEMDRPSTPSTHG